MRRLLHFTTTPRPDFKHLQAFILVDGVDVVWVEKVSDEQYLAGPPPRSPQ